MYFGIAGKMMAKLKRLKKIPVEAIRPKPIPERSKKSKPLPVQGPPRPDRNMEVKQRPSTPMSKSKTVKVPQPPSPVLRRERASAQEQPESSGYRTIKLKSDEWLFSQVTAIASCHIVDGYKITPTTAKFVNNNHNAWSNENMQKYYQTFIGAHNFYNHKQEAKFSYGFVCDAAIRPVVLDKETNETVFYVDLLVATNAKEPPNPAVISRMKLDKLTTWSMGCISTSLQCSRCGMLSENPEDDCNHMKYELGRKYITPLGTMEKTAAIVVDKKDDGSPGTIEFVDISVVDDPAFKGSVSGYKLEFPPNQDIYFRIPMGAWERKGENKNGVLHWHKKGYVEVVS